MKRKVVSPLARAWGILVFIAGFINQVLIYFQRARFTSLIFFITTAVGFGYTLIKLTGWFKGEERLEEKQILAVWLLVLLSAPLWIGLFGLYQTVQIVRAWMFFIALGLCLSSIVRQIKLDFLWAILPSTGIFLSFIFPAYNFAIMGISIGWALIFYSFCF